MYRAHKIMAPPIVQKSKSHFHGFSTTYLNKRLNLRYIKQYMYLIPGDPFFIYKNVEINRRKPGHVIAVMCFHRFIFMLQIYFEHRNTHIIIIELCTFAEASLALSL